MNNLEKFRNSLGAMAVAVQLNFKDPGRAATLDELREFATIVSSKRSLNDLIGLALDEPERAAQFLYGAKPWLDFMESGQCPMPDFECNEWAAAGEILAWVLQRAAEDHPDLFHPGSN